MPDCRYHDGLLVDVNGSLRILTAAVGKLYRGDTELTSPKPSLYERLGGVYAIAAVVDDFIDRIMDDPRLNANPLVG
jgi:hypothetical protein